MFIIVTTSVVHVNGLGLTVYANVSVKIYIYLYNFTQLDKENINI